MKTKRVSFDTYRSTRITGTLLAVTDSDLWLSAEATGGSESDSIIVKWNHGIRNNSICVLKHAMDITIGDVIIMDVQLSTINYGSLFGFVVGKVN